MSEEVGVPVLLYVYDLTNGMARTISPLLLGRQIDGVWHTSIVAYGREYFFGGNGITNCEPGTTVLGDPLRIEKLGETYLPFQIFQEYIQGLATSTYSGSSYNLLEHNCNNFSDEVAQFLCGKGVPKHILDLPNELGPQLRQSITAILDTLANGGQSVLTNGTRHARQDSPDFLQLNTQIEEARIQSQALEKKRTTLKEKLEKKEKKKEKKKKKHLKENGYSNSDLSNGTGMADSAVEEQPTQLNGSDLPEPQEARLPARIQEIDDEDRREEEERKKNREPPIVFSDLKANDVFDKLVESLESVTLSPEEQQSLDELHQYLVLNEGSWALGDNFLMFVGRILNDEAVPCEVRVALLQCLATCALRDDVVLLLHQDRREHTIMNYAYKIDRLTLDEQTQIALFLCNLFENVSSSEWLLYISEWTFGTQQISNIRATTKVAVHSLLSDDSKLKDIGSAVIHNLACKEVKTVVFDDVTVELAMAILQRLQSEEDEEQLFRVLKALAKFTELSSQEVPQLIQMLGPPPSQFRGKSGRIDEQIDVISKRVR